MKRRHTIHPRFTAAQVKRLMKTMKVSYREFAQVMNVCLRTVVYWRSGIVAPVMRKQRELDRLEKAWGIERKPFR